MQAADARRDAARRSAWAATCSARNPDATFAAEALGKLDLIVYLNTTLNTGHARGRGRETLILPVLARDEEPQPTTQESMFNFVRLSDGGPPRLRGPAQRGRRSSPTWPTACSATRRRSTGSACSDTGHIRADDRRRSCPASSSSATIDQTKQEFHIPGRTFHEPRFPTPTGKAQFASCTTCPTCAGGDGELRLMTVRSRRAVQHRRLRGRGHLPRPGPPRRDPDEPGRHRAARAAASISA